jgi:glycerophosphoryl diester phosphodiesterase
MRQRTFSSSLPQDQYPGLLFIGLVQMTPSFFTFNRSIMWPYPKIVAHRGGGTLAPENTLAAVRCGLARGFRAVEFDVMLSKDGIPVVMHDPELGRTIAGSGRISDLTAQELTELDAGSWFGLEFAGERVPGYEQVFQFCLRNGIWMNVEIKPPPGCDETTGRVVAALTHQWCRSAGIGAGNPMQPLLSSFSFDAMLAARAAAPVIPRGLLLEVIPADWQARLHQLGAIALHANQRNLSRELALAAKAAGFGLFCYTVNDVERARELLAWGVDAFCTDRIDLIGPDFS